MIIAHNNKISSTSLIISHYTLYVHHKMKKSMWGQKQKSSSQVEDAQNQLPMTNDSLEIANKYQKRETIVFRLHIKFFNQLHVKLLHHRHHHHSQELQILIVLVVSFLNFLFNLQNVEWKWIFTWKELFSDVSWRNLFVLLKVNRSWVKARF